MSLDSESVASPVINKVQYSDFMFIHFVSQKLEVWNLYLLI